MICVGLRSARFDYSIENELMLLHCNPLCLYTLIVDQLLNFVLVKNTTSHVIQAELGAAPI